MQTEKQSSADEQFSYDAFYYGRKAIEKNFGFEQVKILDGNIGYLKVSEINLSEKSLPVLAAAMAFVSQTKALVIDLKNNGGGGSEVGAVFESFFLPKNTKLLEFKSRTGTLNLEKTVSWLTTPKYDKPLYITINCKTASAAEAFAFALQANKRAKIVGTRSAGAAYMNSLFPVNENLYVSVSTCAPTLPGSNESWEQKGVQPDYVADDQDIELIKKLVDAK